MEESCVLDIADRDGVTLEQVGDYINLTRERIRQIEEDIIRSLREKVETKVPAYKRSKWYIHSYMKDLMEAHDGL
jgi:DNA-directed RNA polymerase sigma subunit (sigma70/sigma32)